MSIPLPTNELMQLLCPIPNNCAQESRLTAALHRTSRGGTAGPRRHQPAVARAGLGRSLARIRASSSANLTLSGLPSAISMRFILPASGRSLTRDLIAAMNAL